MAFDVSTLQLIAYSSLTCASVTVASVSVFLAYRQNFGWEPIALITSYGYTSDSEVTLDFEIWNRRKYPITVLNQEVTFISLDVTGQQLDEPDPDPEWHLQEGIFYYMKKVLLEPNSHQHFSIVARYKQATPSPLQKAAASVTVDIFDPIKNRERVITSKTIKWAELA